MNVGATSSRPLFVYITKNFQLKDLTNQAIYGKLYTELCILI